MTSRLIVETPFVTQVYSYYGFIVYNKTTNKFLLSYNNSTKSFNHIVNGNYRQSELFNLLNSISKKELEILKDIISSNYDRKLLTLCSGIKDVDFTITKFIEYDNIFKIFMSNNNNNNNNIYASWPYVQREYITNDTLYDLYTDFIKEHSVILPKPIYISDIVFQDCTKTSKSEIFNYYYWIYIIECEEFQSPNTIWTTLNNQIDDKLSKQILYFINISNI